jgi:Transmembrane secretion effector
MIMVISRLPKKSNVYQYQEQSSLPRENIFRAMRAQIRYIRFSKAVHILIVHTNLFTLCSSALLSLLPFLAKHELRLDSTGFGLLLGSFGMGAVIGGIAILPKLRSTISAESLITYSIMLLTIVIFVVGFVPNFNILCIIMWLGGTAYITILSEFYTIGMKSAPKWIGSRVLAVYLLILNGGLAIESIVWGIISNIFEAWS